MNDHTNYQRVSRLLRGVAAAVALLLLALAATGPHWEANLVTSIKDRSLCAILGSAFVAMAILGSQFRRAYTDLAIILLNSFLLASALELGSVMIAERERGEDDVVSNSAIESRPILKIHSREFDESDVSRYQPFLLWRRAPYRGQTITIGEAGLRETPGSRCTDRTYKVFAFGGSTMWGAGATDAETIPAFLRAILEGRTGRPVCVVNYGQNGFVISQNVAQLMNLLLEGERPDLAILYDGYNDVYVSYEQGRADRHLSYEFANQIFNAEAPHWYQGLSLYQALHLEPVWQWRDYSTMGVSADELSMSVANRFFNSYAVVEALARQWEFAFALFIQPVISVSNKTLTVGEAVINDDVSPPLRTLTEKIYKRLEAGTKERTRLFDLVDVFDDVVVDIWRDPVHVAAEGNRIVAERMVAILDQQGILTGESQKP